MITIAVTCFIASVYFIAAGGFDIGKWFFRFAVPCCIPGSDRKKARRLAKVTRSWPR